METLAAFHNSPAKGKVVFILSSDRSGSTWLGYVLGSTPDAAFLGEFYRAWNATLRQPCAWCSAHGRQTCEVLADVDQHPVENAYEIALCRTGKPFLIDSSKRTAWAAQFIAPDSHFDVHLIHLIRDPRGWYASEHRRRPKSLNQMLQDWVDENLQIRNFLELNHVSSSTVFYEDLARAPTRGFEELCDRIGCSFDVAALRYWERPHHGFAANGASSPLLKAAPNVASFSHFISGDDSFYEDNAERSFVDERWRTQLNENEEREIRREARVSAFLNLYGRVLTSSGLHCLSEAERSSHRSWEGKFVKTNGDTPELEKIFLVRFGMRHWVTSMQFIHEVSRDWPSDLLILPPEDLDKIPIGSTVRG